MMQERIEKMEEDRRTVERVKLEELEEERNSKRRHEETEALEQKLNKIQPLINEANLCAKEFGRDIYFKAKLVTVIPETLNKSPLDELKNKTGCDQAELGRPNGRQSLYLYPSELRLAWR